MSYQAQEMEQLNRRIAIEVLGEPEPSFPEWAEEVACRYDTGTPSEGGGWRVSGVSGFKGHLLWPPIWRPRPFSEDMELAIRAVDKAFADYVQEYSPELAPIIVLQHPTPDREWLARIVEGEDPHKRQSSEGFGDTAPEAIVRCLLAFVEGGQ